MRDEVERVIKELNIDRTQLFEVSKQKYADIIKKIEQTFVLNGGAIHWSNMGKGFNPHLYCQSKYIGDHMDWYHLLPQIILLPEASVYVLLEDTVNGQPKYWLYEMYLSEFIEVIDNTSPNDFYLISKNMSGL